MNVFAFDVDGELFGFEARLVYRILEDVQVTPVCFTPEAYIGLIYYRGELFDAVDPAPLVERRAADLSEKIRYIVIRWSVHKMAIAVVRIAGLVWTETDPADGVCRTGEGQDVRLLDPDRIWETLRSQPYGPGQVRGNLPA